ncbi:hypothetical protein [Ruegeria pomeroyi]|nr:hypothetical protein [Ruegeria pomeroyi]
MAKSLEAKPNRSPEPAQRKAPSLTAYEDDNKTLQIAIHRDFTRLSCKESGQVVTFGLIEQIASLGSHGRRANENASNFVMGFVDAMEPRDAAKVLLLSQMAKDA